MTCTYNHVMNSRTIGAYVATVVLYLGLALTLTAICDGEAACVRENVAAFRELSHSEQPIWQTGAVRQELAPLSTSSGGAAMWNPPSGTD